MTVETPAPRDVQATVNYYQPKDAQPPYYYIGEPPAGVPASNVTTESYPVVIHDARGKQDTFHLDIGGFQWVKYPSVENEFVDEEKVKTVYFTEVEDILRRYAGGKRVFVFDHTIRRSSDPQIVPGRTARGPVHLVHADQTPANAEQRVKYHLPDDAERLLKGRYQIINVWRPIANPVAHDPLGVADFRSVDVDADLVPTRFIYPRHKGEAYSVKYNPGHKWYYLSDQTPDEVTLIKCFDSDADKAPFAPHSAFSDKTSLVDAPKRQSIEVRAFVFDRE